MLIRIDIPDGVKCLLKAGQNVDFDTDFIERKTSKEIIVHLAKKIGIRPTRIFQHLKKFVGENIKKGEIIAVKKNLFSTERFVCDEDGIIKEIDHNEGKIIIDCLSSKESIKKAFFKGEISEIKNNQIILNVKDGQEFNIKSASCDFGGKVYYLKSGAVAANIANKILLSEKITAYLQTKVEALGGIGFVNLIKLPEESSKPQTQIQNIEDFKKISTLEYPYCLISKKNSKIYFYQ